MKAVFYSAQRRSIFTLFHDGGEALIQEMIFDDETQNKNIFVTNLIHKFIVSTVLSAKKLFLTSCTKLQQTLYH